MEGSSNRVFTMKRRRLLQFVIFMVIMILGGAVETPCEDEEDCPKHQFCYGPSKICVNYTSCSFYNRKEGITQAQSPTQCGGCIEGYSVEVLATGDEEWLCKKKLVQADAPSMNMDYQLYMYVAGGVVFLALIGFGGFYVRKRISDGDEKWFKPIGTWRFTPSAPPQENGVYHLQQPFYTDEEPPIYSSVINNNNNNNNVKDRLVTAVPFNPPAWVEIDNTYDEEDGGGNTSASTAISTTLEIEDEETTPSSWTPENVTVQVPTRPFHQFGAEQRDNVLNAVLVRGDCGSNSTPAEDATSGPAPGATGGTRTGGNTYRGPNVQINQMITLNVVKSDD